MNKKQIKQAKARLIGKKTRNGSIICNVTFASELKEKKR